MKKQFISALVCIFCCATWSRAVELDISSRHEVQANTFTSSSQNAAAVTSLQDGSTVVTWHSRRQQEGTYGIYLQRFSADGKTVGGEQQVNLFTKNMQMKPAIASDSNNSIWVAWESFGQDGSLNAIIARTFTGDQFTGGDEFLVNQSTLGNQSDVVAASCADGQVTFFWVSNTADLKRRCVYSRTFNSSGRPLTDEIIVAESQNHQNLPCVSAINDRIVAVWAEQDRFGRSAGVFGKVLSALGGKLDYTAKPFCVCTSEHTNVEPVVSANVDGGFAVAWLRSTDKDFEVRTQKFNSCCEPISDSIRVTTPEAQYVNGVALESGPEDRCVVTWNQQTDSYGRDINIFGQFLAANGERFGSIFPINVNKNGRHRVAPASGKRRVLWNDRRLLVAWSGPNQNDKSSVNLTALVGVDDSFEFDRSDLPMTEPVPSIARPHEPPTFNPKFIATEPFGGFESLGPPGPDFGFVAINSTGWDPPDPVISVGPNHIVAMTNGAIVFYDKSGNLTFSDQIEGAEGFWGAQGAGGFVFDPETLFDPHSNRFFAMANERTNGRSYFLLAVSDDDNPNGTWFKYRLDVTDIAGNDIDSPNFSVDDEVVYLTADFFQPNEFLVYMLRKSDLLVGGSVVDTSLLITGSHSYGIPMMYDDDAPAFYMLQAFEFGTFSTLRFHAITDPLGNPQRVTTDVGVPSYGHPQDPVQQGTSIRPELFEARFWSCVYRNGSLWAVHHHSPNSAGTVRARWYEFEMNGWPASGQQPQLVQSGELTPTNQSGQQSSTFFPSIWVDEDGNAAITTARSSNSEFISMSRAVRAASDQPGSFQDVELVQASTTPFTLNGRWGDYSGTMNDPGEAGAFWGIHEFALTNGFWQTYIAKYVIESTVTTIAPVSVNAETGTVESGFFVDLAAADDVSVVAQPEPDEEFGGPSISVLVGGNSVDTVFSSLSAVIRSKVNSPNLIQQVELFNFIDSNFVVIDSRAASLEFETLQLEATGDLSEYITPGSGSLLARIRYYAEGPVLQYPWQATIDQFVWQHSD